jgi:hypothetical protein
MSEMVQDFVIVAASILECVGKNWETVEGFLFVDAGGDCEDGRSTPGSFEKEGAERVAKDVVQ